MTFPLRDSYENPIEDKMATLGWLIIQDPDTPYDTAAEGLFAALVRGLAVYVQAWVDSGDGDSLGALLMAGEDLNDPDRANDPNAAFITLLDLTLESLHDNLRYELDPTFGMVMPDE